MTADAITLTKAEAKEWRSGAGMGAFCFVKRLKDRARRRVRETGRACSLVYRGDVLFTATPKES